MRLEFFILFTDELMVENHDQLVGMLTDLQGIEVRPPLDPQTPSNVLEVLLDSKSISILAAAIFAFRERNPGAEFLILSSAEPNPLVSANADSQLTLENIVELLTRATDLDRISREARNATLEPRLSAPPARARPSLTQQSAVARIFYATDRLWEEVPESTSHFGKKRSHEGELSLGMCTVSIPHDHRMGQLERPSIWRLEFREDPEKHVVVLNVKQQSTDEFWGEVSFRVNRSPRDEAFVFVHGYDTSFDDAVRRTAQIAYDLGFEGAPICYSWPSQAALAEYPVDETNAQWTVPHLKSFLQALAEHSQAKIIHVIAHSMGNRAVSHALQLIAAENRGTRCLMRHLVLAAPDIDTDTFKELAESIKTVAERVTLYISPHDKALTVSKRFHGNPRLGETVAIIPGVDTIDASAVDTSLIGHSYYGDNRSVLSDIFSLLRDDKPPRERFGMQMLGEGASVYYAFRP